MSDASQTALARRRLVRWWGWLVVITIGCAIAMATRYFGVTDFDAAPATMLFRAVMLIAHFSALCALVLSPVLALILLWPAPRIVIPAGLLLASATIVGMLIDTQVYQLYRFHINAGVLNLLFGGAALETFVFPREMYVQVASIVVSILLVLALILAGAWRYVRRNPAPSVLARSITALIVASIVGFHASHIWADVVVREALLEQTGVLPLRYAATAKRFLRSIGVDVPAAPTTTLASNSEQDTLSYPLRPLTCEPPEQRRNVIVILIDSWRFDQADASVAPNIADFAQRSVRFTDHYSGGNATRIGVFSFFYAIPGTYWHGMLAERQGPVVVDELLRQGYDVRAFRSAPLYSPDFDRTVFAQVESVRRQSDGDTPAQRDQDLTRDFLEFLDSRTDRQPFFAMLFYDAPHSFDLPDDSPRPFQPTADHVNYLSLRPDTDPRPLLNRYRNSIHFVDALVGEALEGLRRHGLLEDSVVIVTGDHGQEFNENRLNYWGHGSNYSRYQTGVPLILFAPDRKAGVIAHRTTHFDVMPTLMSEYLGCDEPYATYSVGRSLFEPGGRDPLVMSEYREFAIVQPDRIAVISQLGLRMHSLDYSRREDALDAAAISAALEQKSRFYKGTNLEAR